MLWLLPVLNAVAVVMVTCAVVYGLVAEYTIARARRLMPELAYPEGQLPIIGHVWMFIHEASSSAVLWKRINFFCEYYKDGFQGFLGHQVWLFMPAHDIMQEVFASHDCVDKSYVYQALDSITDGVFIAPGDRWRKLRKQLNLTFSVKQIETYMDSVNHHTEVYLNKVLRPLENNPNFIDIQPYIARFYFDIMTMTHFGMLTDEQVKDKFQVSERASKIIELLIEERLLYPHLHIDLLFKFTSLYWKVKKMKEKPLKFVEQIITERMDEVSNQKNIDDPAMSVPRKDKVVYVDLVADALSKMNISPTVYNIQRNSADLLIAGSDTTSITAAALLYLLALHKDIQEKVYEEVSGIYGDEPYRELTRQDLASMTYLDMVVNEALRWSAPAGVLRGINKDFDAGKYVIPKSANIYLLMTAQHRNPQYFEKVDKFYPEHFTPEAVKSRPKMGFLPFSSGPRNCPGKVFAYILIKAATAIVVNNYYLETNLPLDEVTFKIVLMTTHDQGYPIRLIPRHPTKTTS